MEVYVVTVRYVYIQGNGYDDVEFQHSNVDSLWFTEEQANERKADIEKTWIQNGVRFLEEVEVIKHIINQ